MAIKDLQRPSLFVTVTIMLVVTASPALAGNPTTTQLNQVGLAGDVWYNYDFTDQIANFDRVDWPVMAIFYNNADVTKIKNGYAQWYPKTSNSIKYAAMNDGNGFGYDSDRGVKLTACPPGGWFEHMRIYSHGDEVYDRMFNISYGFWVMGTSHFDLNDGCDGSEFGWSEIADSWFAQRARERWGANNVFEDCCAMFNVEQQNPRRVELDENNRNHIWDSDGNATYVFIP
jgi:hypothetical protein